MYFLSITGYNLTKATHQKVNIRILYLIGLENTWVCDGAFLVEYNQFMSYKERSKKYSDVLLK